MTKTRKQYLQKVTAVILAAGRGTRMHAPADKNKVTYELHGRPLVWWTKQRLVDAGLSSIVAVVGHASDSVKSALGDTVTYVTQGEQKGTGHAVATAIPALPVTSETVLTMYGDDSAFYTPELIEKLLISHQASDASMSVLTVHRADPTGLGRIVRDGKGNVQAIVEEKVASDDEKLITEINTGLFCFDKNFLVDAITRIPVNPVSGEYYLTDIVDIAVKKGAKVNAYVSPKEDVWFGVNTQQQLQEANIFFEKVQSNNI
jgi:bifunctional UDP-N-acetylglucosamine pyrophosphorylase/glucosamine-1-phosphate N-acetyltransferase